LARLLFRVGRTCAHHPLLTVVAWILVLGASVGAMVGLQGQLSTKFDVPHAEYTRVMDELGREIPAASGGVGTVVLHSAKPFTPEQERAVQGMLERWQRLDHVTGALDPFTTQRSSDEAGEKLRQDPAQAVPRELYELGASARGVSADGRTAVAQVRFDTQVTEVPAAVLDEIQELGRGLEQAGLEVDYGLDIAHPNELGGAAEIVGLGVAALVLVVMLGVSLVAGLPLLMAATGVGTVLTVAMALTGWLDLHTMAPAFALMLGTAVGLDYSLFVINRHRLNLAQLGAAPDRHEIRLSIARATATAGSAVVVAGTTVVIALAALAVTQIAVIIQMGLLAAAAVAANVLVSLTLTPALLSLLGRRAAPRRRAGAATAATGRDTWPQRWFRAVTRRPALTVLGVVVVLGLVAAPTAALRLGLNDGGGERPGSTPFQAYERIEDAFGAGANGPVLVVADLADPPTEAELPQAQLDVARRLADLPDVAAVAAVGAGEDRGTLAFQVVPTTGPSDRRTDALVTTMTGPLADDLARTGVRIGVTGQTAANIEISNRLAAALPWYILLVVGLSVLLLTVVFRSVVVPLVATAGYLLSAAAAFGAVVAVYQWGWLAGVFGVERPASILSFLPMILIGVLFGLAMDYQMFLVSGMHEARERGLPPLEAVRSGFVSGAKVVTAAALIMIAVFGGFVFSPVSSGRAMGFGLAVGVLADAFLVRMTLTPAVMAMLGERAWYLPRWMERLLPRLDVEGRRVPGHEPARTAAESDPDPDPDLDPEHRDAMA
jgi:RND superfamily putative drug exporter